MSTALTVAVNNTVSTTLATANTLATTIASSTQAHPTVLVSTATGWGEVYSQGNVAAWAAGASQPTVSGHGWLLDSTVLEGQEILQGNWTPTLKIRASSGTLVADIVARAYIYHSGGTYTQIGTVTYLGQTLSTTTGTLTGTATAFSAASFATGDKLYIDVVMNITTPAASGVTISPYESNVANQGDSTTISFTTPGYVAASVSIPVADAGAGTDTPTGLVTTPITDTATGSEPLALSFSIPVSDAGAGTDSLSLATVAPALSDTGVGTDAASVAISGIGVAQPLTPLTAYLTNVPATTLAQSGSISQASGTPTPTNANTPIGTALGYGEITAVGTTSAWPSTGQMSTPTGHGWLLDSTVLEGLGISDGIWSPSLRLGATIGSVTADIWMRASVYHGSTGGYTTIGIMSLTGQTIGATANYSLGTFTFSAQWLNSGDKLYIDAWLNITSNTTGSPSAAMRVFEASSATSGIAQSAVITPGYGAQVVAVGSVDTAVGADSQTLGTVIAPQSDSATGSETFAVDLSLPSDTSVGTDTVTVSTTAATSFNMADTGAASESVPTQTAIALTLYGQSIADSLLPTANTITTTVAGSPSTTTRTTLVGAGSGWSELPAQGTTGAWQGLASPGPQSGMGWIYDTQAFTGQSLAIGLWNAALSLSTNKGTITADLQVTCSLYHSGTQTYTLLGSMLLQGQTINGVMTGFQLPNTLITDWAFQAGDYIYIDVWANITVNSTGSGSSVISILEYNSGGATGFRIMTPGLVATLPQVRMLDAGTGSESVTEATVPVAVTDAGLGADVQGFGTPVFVFEYATGTDGVTLPTITPTLMDATVPDRLAREMLENYMANGFDGHVEINNGSGGLYVNWRYGTNPLLVNFNGTGVPDAYPLPPYTLGNALDIRHDRLTDIRYLQNLYRYKARWPTDHMFDSEVTKYTAIVKQDFSSGFTEQRGWVYDVFYEIYLASGDTWFSNACQQEATYFASLIQSNGMIYTVNTTYPYGYYNTGYGLEEACALIHAGTVFTNATWVSQGYGVLNFMWSHALMSQGMFTAKMINILNADGTTNTDEAFGDSGSGGNQIKTDYTAQMIISLLHAYGVTSDNTLLAKAQTLLAPLDMFTNTYGWWDATNLGYVYYLSTSGSYLSPGSLAISNSKKEAGRQIQMLDAYVLANQYTNNQYVAHQQMMLYVTTQLAYYPAGHGVMYEMATNWSLWPNSGSSSGYEDWVTTEAMGIALNGLLSSSAQPVEMNLGSVAIPTSLPQTETAAGSEALAFGTATAPISDSGSGSDSSLISIPYVDTALGADTPSIAATTPASDTATGSDAASLQAGIPVPDTASGTDTSGVGLVTTSVTDAGMGSEAMGELTALAQSDAASGTDAELPGTILAPQSDSATGSDGSALATITPSISDSGMGGDAQALLVQTATPDTGTGSESASIENAFAVPDSGAGTEAALLSAWLSVLESALGVDRSTITVSFPVSDSASGVDVSVLPLNYRGAGISATSDTTDVIIATVRS